MEKVSPTKVGERIRSIRGERTQTEFAKYLNVRKQNYISRYERGRIPSPELLVKIADMGKVTIDWLLTGKKTRGAALEVRESAIPYGKSVISGEMERVLVQLKGSEKKALIKLVRSYGKGIRTGSEKR